MATKNFKVGDRVHWIDPCTADYTAKQLKEQRATVYTVIDILDEEEGVALITIEGYGGETEVYFDELTPVKPKKG